MLRAANGIEYEPQEMANAWQGSQWPMSNMRALGTRARHEAGLLLESNGGPKRVSLYDTAYSQSHPLLQDLCNISVLASTSALNCVIQ